MKKSIKHSKFILLLFVACLISVFSFIVRNKIVHASSPSYSLATTKTSATNGETIPVTINMDTGGNDVVVSRLVIRYNKKLVNVNVADVDLTGSVFETGNTCIFPSNYSETALQNRPCQIISNDATYGVLSITLAMPSSKAATNAGTLINSISALVATVNFHAIADVSDSLNAMGIFYATNRSYNFDSSMIIDDGNGTDVLSSAPAQRSTASNGDLNGDHFINGADFSILHANFNNTTPLNPADIDGNGSVLDSDADVIVTNYTQNF